MKGEEFARMCTRCQFWVSSGAGCRAVWSCGRSGGRQSRSACTGVRLKPIVGERGSHCVCAKTGALPARGGVTGSVLLHSLSGVRATLLVGDLGSDGPGLEEHCAWLVSSSWESKVQRREY